MRSHHYLTLLTFVALLGLGFAVKINEAPKQRTSAPGESSCGGCHSGNVNTGPATVSLGLPGGYIPGQTYSLSFDVVDTTTFPNPRFGFSTTALDDNNIPAGTFTVTNSSNTSLQTGTVQGQTRSYLGHVNANSTDAWTFDWTAPDSNIGPVTFFAGNVVGNANNSTSGDYAYSNTFTLPFLATFPQPAFTASSAQICGSESITFTDASLGNITAYAWDFGSGAVPATATGAGPHIVSWASDGSKNIELQTTGPDGVANKSLQVAVFAQPAVAVNADIISFCEGTAGVLPDLTISGGTAPLTYAWTCDLPTSCGISDPALANPTFNPTLTPLADTVAYTLDIVDANGCTVQSSPIEVLSLPAPRVFAGEDQLSCAGASLLLSGELDPDNEVAGPITYAWSPTQGLNDPTDPVTTANPTVTTTYVLAGTAPNGCSSVADADDSLTIFVDPLIQAEAGLDLVACQGETINLAGSFTGESTEINILWTSDDPSLVDPTSLTAAVTPAQTFTYFLTVDGGCANATIDSVQVIIGGAPAVDIGEDLQLCEGEAIPLTSSIQGPEPSYELLWSGSLDASFDDSTSATPILSAIQSQSLILTATSPDGCGSTSDTLLITVDAAPIPALTLLGNDSIVAPAGGAAYQWYFVDSQGELDSILGANDAFLLIDSLSDGPENTGSVLLEITYANSCSRLSAPQELPVVSSIISQDFESLRLFPNPSRGQVTLRYTLKEAAPLQLALRDLRGRLVWQGQQGPLQQGSYQISLPTTAKGIFVLDIQAGSSQHQMKLVVQ